jgi:hypothetical protein
MTHPPVQFTQRPADKARHDTAIARDWMPRTCRVISMPAVTE